MIWDSEKEKQVLGSEKPLTYVLCSTTQGRFIQQIHNLGRTNFVSKLLGWRWKDELHCNGQKSTTTCTRH